MSGHDVHCRFFGHVLLDVFQTAQSASTTTTTPSTLVLMQALKHVALAGAMQSPDNRLWKTNDEYDDQLPVTRMVQSWILQAAKENYHDQEAVQRWMQITSSRRKPQNISSSSPDSSDSTSDDEDDDDGQDEQLNEEATQNNRVRQEFVTQKPLCLQCRRPTSTLCEGCRGAYFCPAPRLCRQQG